MIKFASQTYHPINIKFISAYLFFLLLKTPLFLEIKLDFNRGDKTLSQLIYLILGLVSEILCY